MAYFPRGVGVPRAAARARPRPWWVAPPTVRRRPCPAVMGMGTLCTAKKPPIYGRGDAWHCQKDPYDTFSSIFLQTRSKYRGPEVEHDEFWFMTSLHGSFLSAVR